MPCCCCQLQELTFIPFTYMDSCWFYVLQAVGGYDQFFFKYDHSDMIALSLSLWLCGGSILRSKCAMVSGAPSALPKDGTQAIQSLQYAKYIEAVYMAGLSSSVNYPGLEFFHTPQFDIEVRLAVLILKSNFIVGSSKLM